jgi:hypothetical protein
VVWSIASDTSFGTALVANANIRLSKSCDLFCRLLGVATLLRLWFFDDDFDFGLVDLTGTASGRKTPTPSRCGVGDVLALELVELSVDFLRGCFLDVHISHDGTALRMRTFDAPERVQYDQRISHSTNLRSTHHNSPLSPPVVKLLPWTLTSTHFFRHVLHLKAIGKALASSKTKQVWNNGSTQSM